MNGFMFVQIGQSSIDPMLLLFNVTHSLMKVFNYMCVYMVFMLTHNEVYMCKQSSMNLSNAFFTVSHHYQDIWQF